MNSETTGVREMLRANPFGAALIGAGVVWLFAGAAKSETVRGAARAIGDAASESGGQAAERMRAMAGGARDAMADAGATTGEYMTGMADAARRSMNDMAETTAAAMRGEGASGQRLFAALDSTRENLNRMFAAQPLLIAAGGLAIGAAIAASLPMTRTERRTLGDAAGQLRDVAADKVEELKEQASDALSHGVEAARDAGKEAGLI